MSRCPTQPGQQSCSATHSNKTSRANKQATNVRWRQSRQRLDLAFTDVPLPRCVSRHVRHRRSEVRLPCLVSPLTSSRPPSSRALASPTASSSRRPRSGAGYGEEALKDILFNGLRNDVQLQITHALAADPARFPRVADMASFAVQVDNRLQVRRSMYNTLRGPFSQRPGPQASPLAAPPTDPKRSPKSSVAATSASVSTVPTRTTLSPSALLDPTLLVVRIQPTSTQPHPRHPARHPRCPRPNRQNLLRPRCHGATIPCLHRSFTRARQTTQKSRDRYCAPYIGPDAGALHSRRGLAHACSTPPRPRLDLCQVLVPARSHSCSHRFWCYPRLHPSRPRRPSLALARPTPHPARYQDHRRPLVVYGPRRQIRHCPTQHQLFLPPVSFRNRAHGFFPPCLGVPVAT